MIDTYNWHITESGIQLFTFGLGGQDNNKDKDSCGLKKGLHLDLEEALSLKVHSPKVEMHNISGLINIWHPLHSRQPGRNNNGSWSGIKLLIVRLSEEEMRSWVWPAPRTARGHWEPEMKRYEDPSPPTSASLLPLRQPEATGCQCLTYGWMQSESSVAEMLPS